MHFATSVLGLILSMLAALPAQALSGRAMVLSRSSIGPASQLTEVDLANGDLLMISGFSGDSATPQAIAWDPIAEDAIVALDNMGSGARLMRLDLRGTQVTSSKQLAVLAGAVRSLEIGVEGDIFAAVEGVQGGIYRVPRNGGTASLVKSIPGGFIMHNPHQLSVAWLVRGSPAHLELIDLLQGATVQGPFELSGLDASEVTGLGDLPTGATRQVISDRQGRLHLFEFFSQLRQIDTSPPLPSGGSVALRMHGHALPLILGGAALPHIQTFNWVNGDLSDVAGPLPGDPVDFVLLPGDFPRVDRFGSICEQAGNGLIIWSSEPRLGNPTFRLATRGGAPNAPVFLLLGLSSESYLGFQLPFKLPGSPCSLMVSVELFQARQTDATGFAVATIPIPDEPALAGFTFYAQWLQGMAPAVGATEALAVHLGF